ncbi:hypothetical protein IC582_019914 [Cucumis melo]
MEKKKKRRGNRSRLLLRESLAAHSSSNFSRRPPLVPQSLYLSPLPTPATTATKRRLAKCTATDSHRLGLKLLVDLCGTSSLLRLATVCRLKTIHHSWPLDFRCACC